MAMHLLRSIADDLRFALRTMKRSLILSAVAVLSLALGIGATIAIFSVMYALAYRPLPVSHPEQLVKVVGGFGNIHSYPEWKVFRDSQHIFSNVLAYNYYDSNFQVAGPTGHQEVSGLYVSGGYFSTLGVSAVLGRVLQSSDDQPGAPAVCVLGYGLWRRLYTQSRDVLGREVRINGSEFSIVGVVPRSFYGVEIGGRSEIFMPLEAERTYKDYPLLYGRHTPSLDSPATLLSFVGRLKPGESVSQANAGLEILGSEIYEALSTGSGETSRRAGRSLLAALPIAGTSDAWLQDMDVVLLLMVMAAVALIIACANLGNLLLARAKKRQGEIATRLALGATRSRLVRQLVTESSALAVSGAALGLLIASWGRQALIWALSWPDQTISLDFSWDTRLVFFAVGITFCCALLFGLAPAIRATRVSIYSAMTNGVTAGRVQSRFSNSLLVVLQVGLSVALLVSAGLLTRTLHALLAQDPGYDAKGVLTAPVTWQGPGENEQRNEVLGQELLTEFRSLPGVVSASWSREFSQTYLPRLILPGSNGPERQLGAHLIFASSDFFRTDRTPIVAGREFNSGDTGASLPVAVLSEAMAKMLFPGVNPVGLRLRENDDNGKGPDYTVEIVGISKDVQYRRPSDAPLPIFYRPVSQCAGSCLGMGSYEIRATGPVHDMSKRLDGAAAMVDPQIALKTGALSEMVNNSVHRNRAMALIAITFSAFVGLLAMIGVYGVTSYATAERTREIGIRMALGAQPGDVLRMILSETIRTVCIGVALGAGAGLAVAQMIRGMIWGVRPNDPVSFGFAVCAMILVGLLAAYFPARRAMRVDPVSAMRCE